MSPKYDVIIYWSKEDEAFLAEVPELPGCVADGPSHAEALAAGEVMIREWIEIARELGWQIPEARGRLSYGWRRAKTSSALGLRQLVETPQKMVRKGRSLFQGQLQGGDEKVCVAVHQIQAPDQIAASRCTVSGYFLTRLIRRAACAFGLARPCSQFSRVRTLVRR